MDSAAPWCRVCLRDPDGRVLGEWRLDGDGAPSLRAVGEIAQLALAARRIGASVSIEEASPGIRALLELAGLSAEVGIEVGRQAEGGEEPVVEHGQEVVDGGHLPL